MRVFERTFSNIWVAALMLLALSFSTATYAVVGKFQFVNGEVFVIDTAGVQRTIKKGDGLNEGDTVAASSTGFAQIKMEDGGFFAVRPDTRFKVDTFKFSGKEDGSEKGLFSLIKGSLRSVTGLIGKKHRDNYKIQTATSVIGIRGSGADVGHDDAVGTAVRTLFGGHSLTSGGKTLETGPGQTALAPPGQEPRFVPNFPFSTHNAPNGSTSAANKSEGDGGQESGQAEAKAEKDAPPATPVASKDVVIPVLTTENINLTKNITASGGLIGGDTVLATGNYIHHISAIRAGIPSGFWQAEQNNEGFYDPASNYTLDGDGYLVGVSNSELQVNDASAVPVVSSIPSSLRVLSGSLADAYHTPDNSIYIGRLQNGNVETCYPVCSTDSFIGAHAIVALATAPALVQTMTGFVSYNLAGATHPTDAAGNVGTLNTAYIGANFTNQTVDYGVNLSIAGKTLDAYATSRPIINSGFDAKSSNSTLNVTCSGACISTDYAGNVGGAIFGVAGASAALGYDFHPSSNVTGAYTDFITGLVAFTGTAPGATASTAAALGSGVGTVALFGAGDPSSSMNPLNEFSINDNQHFASRNNAAGNLVAFSRVGSGGGTELSFGLGNGSLADTGAASYGVVWGRWSGSYTANSHTNGVDYANTPVDSLHFIQSNQLTSLTQLTALPGLGVTTAVYNGTSGTTPTNAAGALGSVGLLNASIAVNFSTQQITSYNITTGGNGLGTWSASGSGAISNFMGVAGIALSGTCGGAAAGDCSSPMVPITGKATGAFVGNLAQGLISTYSLKKTAGTAALIGTVYTQR